MRRKHTDSASQGLGILRAVPIFIPPGSAPTDLHRENLCTVLSMRREFIHHNYVRSCRGISSASRCLLCRQI